MIDPLRPIFVIFENITILEMAYTSNNTAKIYLFLVETSHMSGRAFSNSFSLLINHFIIILK